MMEILTVADALKAVVEESNNEYAKTYAKAGLELGGSVNTVIVEVGGAVGVAHEKTGKVMVGEELRVQVLYVLSNLAYWRGGRAKEVKAFLKRVVA